MDITLNKTVTDNKKLKDLFVPKMFDNSKFGNKQIIAIVAVICADILSIDIVFSAHALKQYLLFCGMANYSHAKVNNKITKDCQKNLNLIYLRHAQKGYTDSLCSHAKWVNNSIQKLTQNNIKYCLNAFCVANGYNQKAFFADIKKQAKAKANKANKTKKAIYAKFVA